MRCAACSGTGETTDGMCSSCLGTGLVGLSRPQNAINTDLAARLAKAERERDELRVAIMGARADPSVTHGQFIEMAKSTEAARRGGLARAEAAERERDEARAEIERMTPRYVAYDYLESPAGRAALEGE